MKSALISVIIPIYKVSKYLDICIQSVLSQTYTNMEIILVDDGSPDDCPVKCDQWAGRDPRIKVIHKQNGGLSSARNAGLDIASGKYIYFLDGDDAIKPHMLETCVQHMENSNDMVAFRFDSVYSDRVETGCGGQAFGLRLLRDPSSRLSFLLQELLTYKIGWEAWSRMYSRELIEKYKLRFADNRIIFAEDLYFCLCYCAHANKIMCIPDSLYLYGIRDDSIMGQDGKKLNVGRMNELAKAVLAHFNQWDDCLLLVDHFPALFYHILDNVLSKALSGKNVSDKNFRELVRNDISDINFFQSQVRALPRFRSLLRVSFPGIQVEERISNMKYIIDGNYTALRLRNKLIYRFAKQLSRKSKETEDLQHLYRNLSKKSRRIFLLGTEEYGNIGDNQINESVVLFLRNAIPNYTLHEVTAEEWHVHKPYLQKCIRPEDLIVFSGGGNFGDAYPTAQELRAEIIRLWPKNHKIVFPQTVHFSKSVTGDRMLAETCALYTQENHVTLITRDHPSFTFAQQHFSCESHLVPDIVLSSYVSQGVARSQQILLCFRRDIEKTLTEEATEEIISLSKSSGLSVTRTDLQLDYSVKRSDRRDAIEEKFDIWRQAKLVITDRLHGMIFAAITGTPCIVLSNYNFKVRGAYEWISYLPYIRFAESVEDVKQFLPELIALDECTYDNTPLLPHFNKLAEVVKEKCHK